ncbi:DUF333 domain-containing protein, partial [Candidatus Altiarchaeota archaeon]
YKNLNSVNCNRMGYEYVIDPTPAGDVSYCIMPDGTKCLAMDFNTGACGMDHNYCAKMGYETVTGEGELRCRLENGSVEWMTNLVKADVTLEGGVFVEEEFTPRCGDGQCFPGLETHENCPHDCYDIPVIASSTSSTVSSTSSSMTSTSSSMTSTTGEEGRTPTTMMESKPAEPEKKTSPLFIIAGVLALVVVVYIFLRNKE